MRIDGTNASSSVRGGRKSAAKGSGFSLPEQASETGSLASDVQGSPAVQGLDAILALQAVDDATDKSKRAVRHGHDVLDQLEALRADLLAGVVSAPRVSAMIALIRAKQSSQDESLAAVIDEIDLRARVELAKLGVDI